MTQTLSAQEDVTIIFSGDAMLPGSSSVVYCKVDPLGLFPVLKIEWNALAKKWKIDQIIAQEKGAEDGIETAVG